MEFGGKYSKDQFDSLIKKINVLNKTFDNDIYEKSLISKYFHGKTVFLTGGPGFLGHLYIEKLLRIGVKTMYLLIRPKRSMTPTERLKKISENPVFQKLRLKDTNFIERIKIVSGDLSEIRLGINDDDLLELQRNVNIVIHAAADVRFNLPILDLVQSNLRGAREILEIAKQMPLLETFTYISTAYSHCPRDNIEEKFYEPPMDPKLWLKMLEQDLSERDKEIIEILAPHIMGAWPNSYTFTKALSEELVRQYSSDFPVVVIRPSIIVSTYQDPIPGWTNNATGANGLCVGIGVGFVKFLKVEEDFVIDIISADYVVNSTLAAIWVMASKFNANNALQAPEPEIYNITSKQFYLTAERLRTDATAMRDTSTLHSLKCVMYPSINFVKSDWLDQILRILLQAIPSYIIDMFNKDEKYRLLPISRKVTSMTSVLNFFMSKKIYFDNKNLLNLFERMSDIDKKLFPSDSREFRWEIFVYPYFAGLRVYILDDPLSSLPKSYKRHKLLMYIHHTFLALFYVFLLFSVYYITFSKLYSYSSVSHI